MAAFKCKMCGGSLEITEGMTVCECEYCGTNQTVPNADNEKKINLFNRANRLRSACEFDKAATIYESIVSEFSEEAEAYWGLCLCKFGIEYVDDPKTAKKIPTCHRTSYSSIFDDDNFEMACEYADSIAVQLYRSEAKEIDRLQKEILNIAKNEKPFDIFICYKESDENGQRTVDSELAHDLYDVLTEKGYKVFYSRITLKAKLGQDYEPYIFSALNSAKIMLSIGTKYEYYNAIWVKNEWSRFLALMENDKEKMLIPCYKDIDAYDMPKEFKHLQAQDLGSPRAFQDLITNIERIIPKNIGNQSGSGMQQSVSVNVGTEATVASSLKRAFIFIADEEWDKADNLLEQVLNIDPENTQAYLGKLLIDLGLHDLSEVLKIRNPIDENNNYKNAVRFADEELRSRLVECKNTVHYNDAIQKMNSAKSTNEYENAKMIFQLISGFKDSDIKANECTYKRACIEMNNSRDESGYKSAADIFASLGEYSDAAEMAEKCEEKRCECGYKKACSVMNNAYDENDYKTAADIFASLGEYSDAAEMAEKCERKANSIGKYNTALKMLQKNSVKDVKTAIEMLEKIKGYKDSINVLETAKKQLRWLEYSEKIDDIRAKKRYIYIEKTKLGVFDKFSKEKLNNQLSELEKIENRLKLEYKDVI